MITLDVENAHNRRELSKQSTKTESEMVLVGEDGELLCSSSLGRWKKCHQWM